MADLLKPFSTTKPEEDNLETPFTPFSSLGGCCFLSYINIWKANLNFEENEVLSEVCEVSVFLVEAKSPKVPSHFPFSSLLNL
jgi:hypothetical protein